MDNAYTYDAVSNVLSVVNGASFHRAERLADRWRIPMHTMPSTVLSVQWAHIQERTTRPQVMIQMLEINSLK